MQPTATFPPPLWWKIAPHTPLFPEVLILKKNFQTESVRATQENNLEPLIDHPHLPLGGKWPPVSHTLLIFDFGKNLFDKNCFSYSEKEFRTEMQLIAPFPAPLWMKRDPN